MKILVVEDSPRMAGALKRGLTKESYAVDVAPDSPDGLALAQSGEYDAVLLDITVSEGLLIAGDGDLYTAAVGNVLENAARYASEEPPTLRVESDDAAVRVTITDSGPGISALDRERVFEPLTHLDERAAKGTGLGLGLTVARATLRAFGGDLTCQPRADGETGASFVFTFQRVPEMGPEASDN